MYKLSALLFLFLSGCATFVDIDCNEDNYGHIYCIERQHRVK